MIDQEAALIYAMIMASASDRHMTDDELATIGDLVSHLPAFAQFDPDRLPQASRDCALLLSQKDGMHKAFAAIKGALDKPMRETAYALACDVAASVPRTTMEERRLLELLRRELEVDTLVAAAMQRASKARYARAG